MNAPVAIIGLRWAVEVCHDGGGTFYEAQAWMIDKPGAPVVLFRVYVKLLPEVRDTLRLRILSLHGYDSHATLMNELGEVIRPGG